MKNVASRAMLERIPIYLSYLKERGEPTVSSTTMARELSFGEVQVRKDLSLISGAGRPKIGYKTEELRQDVERFLGCSEPSKAVIVGTGKIGSALMGYGGFESYGVTVAAGFDCNLKKQGKTVGGKEILPIDRFTAYCNEHSIKIGIITVPAENAQSVAELMAKVGIKAIWNFAPIKLSLPEDISVINERLAISLSLLNQSIKEDL